MNACPVLVIRPEPGNAATVAAAEALGLPAIAMPLSEVEAVPWMAPPAERFDAILLGSANAVRCGGDGLAALTGLPAYAVGEATADAARRAGFAVIAHGSGGLQELLPALAADRRREVLRLAGEERVSLDPPSGLRIQTIEVYRIRPRPFPDQARALLRGGAIVLLHSAAAARHFAERCDAERIARSNLAVVCLDPRIAAAAGAGWRLVRTAPRPTDAALLALAAAMCQSEALGVRSNTIG